MTTPGRLCLIALVAVAQVARAEDVGPAEEAGQAEDAGQAWDAGQSEPAVFVIDARSAHIVELQAGVDAVAWARAQGLGEFAEYASAGGGSFLSAHLPGGSGDTPEPGLCQGPGVVGCDRDYCRRMQIAGFTRGPHEEPAPGVLVALVRVAPHVSAALGEGPETGSCRSGTGDFALGRSARLSDARGGFELELPAGAAEVELSCWELVAAHRCTERRARVDAFVPDSEPDILIARIAPDEPDRLATHASGLAAAHGLRLLELAELPSTADVLLRLQLTDRSPTLAQALAGLAADPVVRAAQREYRYRTHAQYGDPLASLHYGPDRIGALELHATATGVGVTVAVIDSGVDATHAELGGRIAHAVDLTGQGPSADVHGTAVASVIAAERGNGLGAFGVAPGASLLALQACRALAPGRAEARCWSSTIARAIDLAIERGARVINLAVSGPRDPLVERLVGAARAADRLVVAAAGDLGPDGPPAHPAALEGVLAVTAIDAADRIYRRAAQGDWIDFAAPGVDVISATPQNTFPRLSGTSLASAHVSGAAALLLELAPERTAAELADALRSSARDLGPAGPDPIFGLGRIDVCAAADRLAGSLESCGERH